MNNTGESTFAQVHAFVAARMGASVAIAFGVPPVSADWHGLERAVAAFAHALVRDHRKQNGELDMRRVMALITEGIRQEIRGHDGS